MGLNYNLAVLNWYDVSLMDRVRRWLYIPKKRTFSNCKPSSSTPYSLPLALSQSNARACLPYWLPNRQRHVPPWLSLEISLGWILVVARSTDGFDTPARESGCRIRLFLKLTRGLGCDRHYLPRSHRLGCQDPVSLAKLASRERLHPLLGSDG